MTPFLKRINSRLDETQAVDIEIESLLEMASSPARFDSQDSLQAHLTEGAMLNVTKIASNCLSIPSGNYVVWLTDSGKTVLVPSRNRAPEVMTKSEDKYELHTAKLLGMWNKLERTLAEEMPPQGRANDYRQGNEAQDVSGHFANAPESMPDEPYTFGKNIGRDKLWSAMQRAGIGVSQLADRVGVDKSTISRLLRDVQSGPGDPGGRNPSVAVAQRIAQILGVDVNEVLPPPEDLQVTRRTGTSGSGAGGGKNAKQMTQGGNGGKAAAAAQESKVKQIAGLMAECRVNPVQIITESLIGIPAAEPVLNEFLKGMMSKLGLGKKDPATTDKANGDKLFDTAINAINGLTKAYGRIQGAGGFTARVGDKKMALDQWLSSISHNLNKIKAKMPEVQQKHQQAALGHANAAQGKAEPGAEPAAPASNARPEYTTGKNGVGMNSKPAPAKPKKGEWASDNSLEGRRRSERPLSEFNFSKGSRLGGGGRRDIPLNPRGAFPLDRMGFTGSKPELADKFQDESPDEDWSSAIDQVGGEAQWQDPEAHWDKTMGIKRDAEGRPEASTPQTPEEMMELVDEFIMCHEIACDEAPQGPFDLATFGNYCEQTGKTWPQLTDEEFFELVEKSGGPGTYDRMNALSQESQANSEDDEDEWS